MKVEGSRLVTENWGEVMIFPFEKLEVWQEAVDFAKKIYEITNTFPLQERFGITAQCRRASISISLNIAEGHGRYHKREFKRFLFIARGSLYETLTLLRLARELDFFSEEDVYENLIDNGKRILSKLSGLINSLSGKSLSSDLRPQTTNLEPLTC